MAHEIPTQTIGSAALLVHIDAHLRRCFTPLYLLIQDESAAHAGHAGAQAGGHFRVLIVAQDFAGQTRITRHRRIYEALEPWLQKGIHALAITALIPEEFSVHS